MLLTQEIHLAYTGKIATHALGKTGLHFDKWVALGQKAGHTEKKITLGQTWKKITP